jgi:hypothetical protein
MTDQEADLDRRLREAFEDDPAASERLVRAVSAVPPGRGRSGRGLAAGLVATVSVAVAALGLWSLRPAPAPAAPGAPDASFTDGVLVLPLSDGTTAILGPGTRDERPPEGFGIVLISGDSQ